MSTNVKQLPMLDGSNWVPWSSTMEAYLRSVGVWRIVRNAERCPEDAPSNASADVVARTVDTQNSWHNRDDIALGAISLRLSEAIKTHVKDTSHLTWEALKKAYGTPGAALLFSDFKKVISHKISGNKHPTLEIAEMSAIFERLDANQCAIPEFIKAMILLAAMPTKWDSIASYQFTSLQVSEFKYNVIRDAIVAEYERLNIGRSSNSSNKAANKISGVKRKANDPEFKKKSYNDKKQTRRGKRNGKKTHWKKPNDKNVDGHHHEHSHEHTHVSDLTIASPAIFPPPITA